MNECFYVPVGQEDAALRFGDVLRGLVRCIPSVDTPNPEGTTTFNINVSTENLFAVISPCCSIGESKILLAPLIQLSVNFFKNPYFTEDFTRINSPIPVEKSLAPEIWDELSLQKKTEKLQQPLVYVYLDTFIYEEHPSLPEYILKVRGDEKKLRTYAVDFRHTFQLSCSQIHDPKKSPLNLKIIQLSINTRQTLREKIAKFYSRTPKEDMIA